MRTWRRLSPAQAVLMVLAFTSIVLSSDAEARMFDRKRQSMEQPRIPRQFHNLQTARGFGKRAQELDQETDAITMNDPYPNRLSDSFPVEWFAEEMARNPALAETILRKFVDVNSDGILSVDELLRPGF